MFSKVKKEPAERAYLESIKTGFCLCGINSFIFNESILYICNSLQTGPFSKDSLLTNNHFWLSWVNKVESTIISFSKAVEYNSQLLGKFIHL